MKKAQLALFFDHLNLANTFSTVLELSHNYDHYIHNVDFKFCHNDKMLKWMDSCSRSWSTITSRNIFKINCLKNYLS